MEAQALPSPVTAAASRWSGHRIQAALVWLLVYVAPIGGSIVFVHYASRVVPAPTGSLAEFAGWWLGLSGAATVVLVAIDRVTRRLLPLAALLKLSLIFPDEAPSRFKVAFRSGSVERLEERVATAASASSSATPGEAAARLLELVALLNIHDRLTRGHCDRVRAYSVLIGKELGLSDHELDLLNWAALLHDVGKLDVPSAILVKPGKPTDEEWQVLRKHPLFGEVLVEPMREWLGTWTQAVGHHHERWDGKGYPRGLAGDDIPLPGRIVAVADVFDVITSARSYKKASAVAEARKEIAACAGSQFDPRVVRAFLNVSLGRMRFVMGPLSWLAHAPLLGRLPLTPAIGTFTGAVSVVATSTAGGIVVGPKPATALAATPPPVAHVRQAAPASAPTPHPRVRVPPVRPTAHPPASPGRGTPQSVAAVPAAPPAAADNDATVYEGGTVQIDVLANDSGTTLQLQSVDRPSHGDATIVGAKILYHAPLGFRGTDSFGYRVADASGRTATATVTVDSLPVNHAPGFTPGPDVALLENAAALTRPWASGIDAGAGDAGQQVRFDVTTDNRALFSTQPELAVDGTLTVAPARDAYGSATVDAVAVDDGGTANGGLDRSVHHVFSITVLPVNQPPRFVGGGNVQVVENTGAQALTWASQISPGPASESSQHVGFSLANDRPSLFAAGGEPAIDARGVLTFTPAPFATGSTTVSVVAKDDGGTANGGRDTAAVAGFTLSIVPRNQPPVVKGVGDVSALENAGPQSLQWATSIDPGAANESAQTVTLTTTDDNPGLFAVRPVLSQSGRLTYTPAANASGTATVTVTASDDGGTQNGGRDSSTASFTITILPVNHAPSFTAAGNQTVLEDGGAQSTQWATAVSPGPGESGQTVTFTTSNDDNALFSGQPAVGATGLLTYTPAANANGTATVTVKATDDGGTANGGHNSTTATFTITVTPVNDAPTFTAAGNQTVLEDGGAQSTQWATAVSPGPGESGQTVTFTTSNDDNALFSAQPAVGATGLLTYTPAANANGTATVTVKATDDGGTANGGHNSTTATFTINLTPVNDAPAFVTAPADQTVNEDDGEQVIALTSFSSGPANESAQTITVTTSNDHSTYFDAAGQPTVSSGGTLTFTPAVGAYGTATVTVTATDDGGTANGGLNSVTATFTITIDPLPPVAGDDSYTTTVLTPLSVSAPGLLANDGDVNSSTLTVTAGTGLPTSSGGTVDLNADGSFTYTPPTLSLGGQDSFTYTITDGNGQTATGTVTITVTLLGASTTTWYLDTSGLSSDVWNLSSSPPATVAPVPDLDADGKPGLTIAGGDGKESINDAHKQHAWAANAGVLGLSSGSVTLHLTAATENFDVNRSETIWLYVYDCPAGLSTLQIDTCTQIGSNKVLVPDWNTTATWATHDIVASLDAGVGSGRQLRVRVLVSGRKLWIPLVSPYDSSVDLTG